MPTIRLPIYLPNWIHRPVRRVADQIRGIRTDRLNLSGDRDVEVSFIAGHLPAGPGQALDFGCGPGFLSLLTAERGYEVTAVDLSQPTLPWRSPHVRFVQGDILKLDLHDNSFDVIVNCSAIEHVGLAGNYGIAEQRDDGDLEAMARMRDLMKPGGVNLLTTPCGRDSVFSPAFRVYGSLRLPRLLNGYRVEREQYWIKDQQNRWGESDQATAFDFEPHADLDRPYFSMFALGCFVLRK